MPRKRKLTEINRRIKAPDGSKINRLIERSAG
jgi:hypothetical protein